MKTIFAQEPLTWTGPAIFLAGPTLRGRTRECGCVWQRNSGAGPVSGCWECHGIGTVKLHSWRVDALELLSTPPVSDVTIIVPEFRDWREWTADDAPSWTAQVEWEHQAMEDPRSVLMFWIPRNMKTLPGMTTNVEFGYYLAQRLGSIVMGWPDDAEHVRYLQEKTRLHLTLPPGLGGRLARSVPRVWPTLQETCSAALRQVHSLGYT